MHLLIIFFDWYVIICRYRLLSLLLLLANFSLQHKLLVFHWSLSLLMSPELFWGFWPILTMLSTRLSRFFPWCSIPSVFLKTVSSSLITISIIITIRFQFFFSSLTKSKYLSVFSFIFPLELHNPLDGNFSLSLSLASLLSLCWLALGLAFLLGLDYLFVSQNSTDFYASNSLGRILVSLILL